MTEQDPLLEAWAELGKIDYFLDNLARAVERGEVPRSSYDLLAPRYLNRRQELVEALTGAAAASSAVSRTPRATAEKPARGWRPSEADFSALGPPEQAQPATRTRRALPRPVEWTTVLLFLGAFLVIVASAIFAIAVWDVLGVGGKLGFMGGLTVGFYAAGWWARRKLGLVSGSVALFAVASAMLLFDGWIVIDGYGLEGALPWAVLLLMCSVVYWFTETRLNDRFFGVIGAAAQLGWWWLLGQGLGWPVVYQLAGIAVVALVWQVTSERARGDRVVGTLADVLAWAAPIVSVSACVGLVLDLALVRSAGAAEVTAAFVVSGSALAVMWRSEIGPTPLRNWLASALQLPLLAFAWTASVTTGPSWWIVAALAAAALVYDSLAIYQAGVSLSWVGLLAELTLVLQLCLVLDTTPRVTVLAVAALGALWAAASRLARREEPGMTAYTGLRGVAATADVGSIVVLLGSSAAVLFVTQQVALTGQPMTQPDAMLALGVLAAWLAAFIARPTGATLICTVLFSLYATASVLAWAVPNRTPAFYALGLVVPAALWLLLAPRFERWAGPLVAQITVWLMRAAISLIGLAGLILGHELLATGTSGAWEMAALSVAVSVVYFADALHNDSRVGAAAAAGWLAIAGFEMGTAVSGEMRLGVVAAAATAVLIAAGAAVAAKRWFGTRVVGVSSAAVASALALIGVAEGLHLAAALALCALAWALSGFAVGQFAAAPASLFALGAAVAVLAALEVPGWVTLIVVGATGFALAAPTFTRRFGPGGRYATTGLLAAVAGLGAHAVLVSWGLESGVLVASEWRNIGSQGLVIALIMLGVNLLGQAAAHRTEAAWYAGFGALLLALFAELRAVDVTQVELYTTPLAVYLAAMGYVFIAQDRTRTYPVAMDVACMVVGLGIPLLRSLTGSTPEEAFIHAMWTVGLSLLAIGAGVIAKSHAYFFGGVGALATVAFYRSFVMLVSYWWLVLGVIGVVMLVIALTWERQRMVVSETRERLRASFQGWR